MIVWITHVKVGHRQTPYKQQSPPREGFAVYAPYILNIFDRPESISDNAGRFDDSVEPGR
jgi:hypothetical protein